ncbi:MAG: NUDIX hydrolase [Minisyncoccia bacterium]
MDPTEVHFIGKVAMKVVVERSDGAILLVRDFGKELWDLPGGRLNTNELPLEALAREVREELGIAVEIKNPVCTDTFLLSDEEGHPHFLVVYRAVMRDENDSLVLAPDEIEEARWATEEEIKELSFWKEYERALAEYFAQKKIA